MGQNRRTQAIQECAGKQEPPIDEHLTDAERKYRRQPREWVAEFVKAGLPEDFIDRQVRLLKRGKNDLPYGWACYAQMKPLKLFPVSIIYLALNARLEYSNVTYQETCKCCEQIVYWGGLGAIKRRHFLPRKQLSDHLGTTFFSHFSSSICETDTNGFVALADVFLGLVCQKKLLEQPL